jgi:hypothetical protein
VALEGLGFFRFGSRAPVPAATAERPLHFISGGRARFPIYQKVGQDSCQISTAHLPAASFHRIRRDHGNFGYRRFWQATRRRREVQ